MLNAGGYWCEMKQRRAPDDHQVRRRNAWLRDCSSIRTPAIRPATNEIRGARTGEGLWQASEIYTPLQAWQALGPPTIAINANFFDVRGQKGGSWKSTGCSSPLGAYVDNTRGQGRANSRGDRHRRLRR